MQEQSSGSTITTTTSSSNNSNNSDSPSLQNVRLNERKVSQRVVKIEKLHFPEIRMLVELNQELHDMMFKHINYESLIINNNVAVGVRGENNSELLGVINTGNYPNIPAISPWDWDLWFTRIYGLSDVFVHNSLWINFFAYHPDCTFNFTKPIFRHIFRENRFVDFLLVVVPPGIARLAFLDHHAIRLAPLSTPTELHATQTVYVITRKRFMHSYRIRRALEEDNDEIVELIHHQSDKLKMHYGDFYISEILAKDEERKLIVAEFNEQAVGVVMLNPFVDLKKLQTELQLGPYNDLVKNGKKESKIKKEFCWDCAVEDEVVEVNTPVDSLLFPSPESEVLHLTDSSEFSIVTNVSLEALSTDSSISDKVSYVDTYFKKQPSSSAMKAPTSYLSLYQDSTVEVITIPTAVTYEDLGTLNAFSLEIMATNSKHEECLKDLLGAAFACFPERDYCVLSIPHNSSSFVVDRFFTRIPLKERGCTEDVIYALHRNALSSTLKVVAARLEHVNEVEKLMVNIQGNTKVCWRQFRDYIKNPYSKYLAYVMLSDDHVIGVAILSEEHDVKYLNTRFDVARHTNPKLNYSGGFGLIQSCLVSIHFRIHFKFFMYELHRLSDFHILYYKLVEANTIEGVAVVPANNLLQHMIPAAPRLQPDYDLEAVEDYMPCEEVLRPMRVPMALFICSVSICNLPRLNNNTRVVVVGASTTALAFLEALLWRTDEFLVTFNNVMLICLHPPVLHKTNEFRIKRDLLQYRFMSMLYFKCFVSTVVGEVTGIDRKERFISVDNTNYVRYDLLFLMCGEQFQLPLIKGLGNVVPSNIFTLNYDSDFTKVEHYVRKLQVYSKYKIVVYGICLQAYCILTFLLELGVPGEFLTLVEPFPNRWVKSGRNSTQKSVFNDPAVDQAVLMSMREKNINLYESSTFVDWTSRNRKGLLSSVRFVCQTQLIDLDCSMFIIYERKMISPGTFQAIINAGLVFDGRLVIDSEFRTNDKFIYGAGTMTKYSRRYYAEHMIHKHFNREEIGRTLGQKIKSILIPPRFCDETEEFGLCKIMRSHTDTRMLVSRYVDPIMQYAVLPGKLYYLSVSKPGLKLPSILDRNRHNYGTELITGDCTRLHKQGYFKIHLNQFDMVEDITCLSKTPFSIVNTFAIWGRHEQLLNNLKMQYHLVRITDFFEFFKEPWAYTIYHDKCPVLLNSIEEYLKKLQKPDSIIPIYDRIIHAYKIGGYPLMPDWLLRKFEDMCLDQMAEEEVKKFVIEFLEEHRAALTMYAIPTVICMLLKNSSPVF